MTEENQRIESKKDKLVRFVHNHPILSSTLAGIVSSGVLGITELGVKSVIDYLAGTDYKHSPVFSPYIEMLLGLSTATFGLGFKPGSDDFHENQVREHQAKLLVGLSFGSAAVGAGLNKIVHGGYFL